MIPYQLKALEDGVDGAEPSRCMENFRKAANALARRRAGKNTPVYPTDKWHYTDENAQPGAFKGWVFQDSDLYKWIEAASYSLGNHPDAKLESAVDEAIRLVCSAAEEDGYIDTLYTINNPAARFENLRDFHELYCFGHLAEAACAHFSITGKPALLNAAARFADLICRVFGKDGKKGYDGHPIAEEALLKLYEVTGEHRYLDTARIMIDRRGTRPYYFDTERDAHTPDGEMKYMYNQAHLPVRNQKEAAGHAVRAVYLYTAMAHLARLDQDEALLNACKTLFDDITRKKMYITGGIGSTKDGEAFTYAYDLPNGTAYSETCASVGLVFFARRMMQADCDSKYFNAAERCLYNCILAGMAEDGKSFFYTNPLEAEPKTLALDERRSHIKPVRQKWFDCACCPPNIARLISDLGEYIFTENNGTVFINFYDNCTAECESAAIEILGDYTGSGKVNVKIKPKKHMKIAFRIPEWSENFTFSRKDVFIKKGYAYFEQLADRLDDSYQIILIGLSKRKLKTLHPRIHGVMRTNSMEELAEYYSMADAYVNTTLEDTFPTTNLEALACGTPVITFATGGSVESVDASCGKIVPKGDMEALIKAIEELRGEPDKKEDCLRRAAGYDKNDRFQDYLKLYRSLLEKQKLPEA